jgi:hypothetical protein
MVGAIGFEFYSKRSFNNIETTAGTVKQWKTVVSSANGSQTDHTARSSNFESAASASSAIPALRGSACLYGSFST